MIDYHIPEALRAMYRRKLPTEEELTAIMERCCDAHNECQCGRTEECRERHAELEYPIANLTKCDA